MCEVSSLSLNGFSHPELGDVECKVFDIDAAALCASSSQTNIPDLHA